MIRLFVDIWTLKILTMKSQKKKNILQKLERKESYWIAQSWGNFACQIGNMSFTWLTIEVHCWEYPWFLLDTDGVCKRWQTVGLTIEEKVTRTDHHECSKPLHLGKEITGKYFFGVWSEKWVIGAFFSDNQILSVDVDTLLKKFLKSRHSSILLQNQSLWNLYSLSLNPISKTQSRKGFLQINEMCHFKSARKLYHTNTGSKKKSRLKKKVRAEENTR